VATGFDAVVAEAEQRLAEYEIPGAAIGILSGGEERYAGLGVTSIDNPLPVDEDTLFQAGSITKTLTATAAVRLSLSGEVDLDVPVRTYLPELRLADEDVAERITMRDLLTHGGGFAGDLFHDLGWGDDALERIVSRIHEAPQLTPLRAVWSYNNAGFYAAGRVLEVVTGTTYEEAIRELVLDEALFFPWEIMTRRFAVGHSTDDLRTEVMSPWAVPRSVAPAGGLLAGARTLLRYARMHLDDRSLAPMQEPALPILESESMGLAWFVKDGRGPRIVEHGGTTSGQCAWLTLVPENDLALVLVTNHARGHAFVGHVREHTLAAYAGIEPWNPVPRAMAPAELEEYAGTYEAYGGWVRLRLEDGRLVLAIESKGGFPKPDSPPPPMPPPAPVEFSGEDAFYVPEGPLRHQRGRILRDEEGRIEWLRFGHRIHLREGRERDG
jgi:CubicO group peptidase (beta-lactamase class C family)